MGKVISVREVKIKPENRTVAEGEVVKCRYGGNFSSGFSVGFGSASKVTHFFKVSVKVEGIEKPLILKVKEKEGWNLEIVNDLKTFGKAMGMDNPVEVGEKIVVAYDRTKPKRCNVADV